MNGTTSLNNRLAVEVYKKEGLRQNVQNGFARPDQKVTVKGLKVLLDAKLNDGSHIAKGSTAYIREESLHTRPWAQKILEADIVGCPFLLVELSEVEFVSPPPISPISKGYSDKLVAEKE